MPESTFMQPTNARIPVERFEQRPYRALAAPLGRLAVLLAATALLLILAACSGSSADPAAGRITEPVFGVDETGASFIGVDRCLGCHEALTPAAVASYLGSRHARPGTVGADAGPACLSCHDPLGDGVLLGPWFADLPQPPAGMTAVGCENCHGAGAHHLATIPAHPNPNPDFTACGRCHTALPPGPAGHAGPLADDILAQYLASAHAQSLVLSSFPLCARCHSDEGFRLLGPQTAGLDAGGLEDALSGAAPITDPSLVQCRTCHDGHSGILRAEDMIEIVDGLEVVKYSRQFNLCTSCHQVFLEAEFNPQGGGYVYFLDTGKIPYHGQLDDQGRPLPSEQVIWDTHFATRDGSIGGYRIDPAAEQACVRCHDPHGTMLR
jgi:hypothetical protein